MRDFVIMSKQHERGLCGGREIANHNLTDKNIQTYLYLFLHSLANCRCGETRGKNKRL